MSFIYVWKTRSGSSNLSSASGAALDAIQAGIEGLDDLGPATLRSGYKEPVLHHRDELSGTDDEDAIFERTTNLLVGGLFPKIQWAVKAQLVASLVSRRQRLLTSEDGEASISLSGRYRKNYHLSSHFPPVPRVLSLLMVYRLSPRILGAFLQPLLLRNCTYSLPSHTKGLVIAPGARNRFKI